METAKINRKMVGFHKALFDNTHAAVNVVQEYSGNMARGFVRQMPWATEEMCKTLDDSLAFWKTARNQYRKAVDQGYDKLADLLAPE